MTAASVYELVLGITAFNRWRRRAFWS